MRRRDQAGGGVGAPELRCPRPRGDGVRRGSRLGGRGAAGLAGPLPPGPDVGSRRCGRARPRHAGRSGGPARPPAARRRPRRRQHGRRRNTPGFHVTTIRSANRPDAVRCGAVRGEALRGDGAGRRPAGVPRPVLRHRHRDRPVPQRPRRRAPRSSGRRPGRGPGVRRAAGGSGGSSAPASPPAPTSRTRRSRNARAPECSSASIVPSRSSSTAAPLPTAIGSTSRSSRTPTASSSDPETREFRALESASDMRDGRANRRYHRQSHALHAGDVHRQRSRSSAAVLHESRRAGVRPDQPARGREGRVVRPLLALGQEPAPPVSRRIRRRSRSHRRPHRRRHRRPQAGRGPLRTRLPRVRRRLRRPARRRPPRM